MKKLNIIYLLIPLALFAVQAYFTFHSMGEIRYEELAEGVRDPFYLSHHLMYDGTSSNIGWYGLLLIVYKLFGFNLFTYKLFRLIFQLFSLFSLAYLLKKFLGARNAIVPLFTLGLSPILLYFTTLGAEYGFDLQLLPILGLLFVWIRSKSKKVNLLATFFLWLGVMVGWLSYPIFILYIPLIFILFIIYNKQNRNPLSFAAAFAGFMLPFLLAILWVQNRDILFFDPNTQSGLFRGAGSISFDPSVLSTNITSVFSNLFVTGTGYHFNLANPDLNLYLPLLSLAVMVFFGVKLAVKNHSKLSILALILIASNFLLVAFTLDPSGNPGGRRDTALVAGFYLLFVLAWHYATTEKMEKVKRNVLLGILLLLPLHHLLVFPTNAMHLNDLNASSENQWLGRNGSNPQESFQNLLSKTQKEDLKLSCKDIGISEQYCRYSEIYPAIAGACEWNHLDCHQILGFDDIRQQYIPLSTDLWESNYLQH